MQSCIANNFRSAACYATQYKQKVAGFTAFDINSSNLPHVPPKYPHPNSHYQPFTTKALMMIGVIATGVAIPVTLDNICPIIVFHLVKF